VDRTALISTFDVHQCAVSAGRQSKCAFIPGSDAQHGFAS
jgi:hypothetical protein